MHGTFSVLPLHFNGMMLGQLPYYNTGSVIEGD
jgi:hypothetical protein